MQIRPSTNLVVVRHCSRRPKITQAQLEELILLHNQFLQACKRYKSFRQKLFTDLQRGARIEPGVHCAALTTVSQIHFA